MSSKAIGVSISVLFLIFSGGLLIGYGTCIYDFPSPESHNVSIFLIGFGCVLTAIGSRRLFRILRRATEQDAAANP